MKSLHWLLVGVLMIALLGVPLWYTLTGQGAQSVPGEQEKVLRSRQGRLVTGGGRRLGK